MHGAGLSNIVFSQRGTKVLELGSRLHHNTCFQTLAERCGLPYTHWYLASAPACTGGDTRFANVVADIDKFQHQLAAFTN